MASIFGDIIEKRILNDLSALDEAEHILSGNLVGKFNNLPNHGTGNRGALLDMLDLLGIENQKIVEDEDVLNQFKEILHQQNYTFTVVELADGWWKHSNGHMLGVSKETGVFVPLMSRKLGYYIGNDVNNVGLKRVNKKVSECLEPFAYCFHRTLPSHAVGINDFLKFVLRQISKYRLGYILVITISISLLNMMIPYATKAIYDEIIPSGISDSILPIFAALVGVAFSIGLLTVMRNIITFSVKDSLSISMQSAMLNRALLLKPKFFKNTPAASISDYVFSVLNISDVFSEQIVSMLLSLLVGISFLFQIGYYSHFTVFSFVIYLILALDILVIYAGFRVRSNLQLSKIMIASGCNGLMYNYMLGIQKIKTNGAEARVFKNWVRAYDASKPLTWADSVISELPVVFFSLCMLFIVLMVPNTEMSMSDYAAFFAALVGFLAILNQFSSAILYKLSKMLPGFELMKPVLSEEHEEDESSKIVSDISGSISITGLNFRYEDNMPLVVDDLNLHINPGEYVAIVGPSGCGKSTLMRLMLGFETAQSGSVFYDHYNVSTVNKSSLRQHLGICLQGGRLFAGTLLDNIRISNPLASEEEVWEAARIADIADDIKRMPGGLYHKLDASGAGISGGQRQRIMIARAVLNKPAIIFLDEATSALDNISQHRVIENLAKLNCTRITIAHRLSTIRDCDRIIVLNKGHVAEEGTFDNLMARKGLLYEIAHRQQL